MSLYHTYIASRPKADSVIQGITIPSQINQRMKKTVPIFNLHEYPCLAPHTMNNYINKLSCLYIFRTKKLLVRSTCVGPYLILIYDWRESCLLIGLICLHKSLCLPGNWSKPVQELILHENQLELVSRS